MKLALKRHTFPYNYYDGNVIYINNAISRVRNVLRNLNDCRLINVFRWGGNESHLSLYKIRKHICIYINLSFICLTR